MASKKAIMEYFPYENAREQQREVLETIEKYWESYDVFVIVVPTAGGKSSLAKTVSDWRGNTAFITPTNLLVRQFSHAFPTHAKLFRRSFYTCPRFANGSISCEEAYKKYGGKKLGCSRECDYLRDNARARGRTGLACNYYTYMANKLYKPTLIADEAHGLIKLVQDMSGQKLWRHEWHYPWDMWTHGDIIKFVEERLEIETEEERIGTLKAVMEELTSTMPRYVIKRGRDLWNKTQPPEERELLTMLPVDVRDAPPYLWPARVQKIVLMSATISYKDIESLGLDRRRVLYLETDSPIAPANRPIVTDFVGDVNRSNMKVMTEAMCKRIESEYLVKHQGEKGVIHATYAQARLFRDYFGGDDRFIFHGKDDVKQQFQKFVDSDVKSGKVMVASGLYEGIDLVGDLGRWQIIAKVPWLNLGDPAIKYKAADDPSWFCWSALQTVMQGCGRICRTPDDYGITYIMDGSFKRLVRESEKHGLVPNWWREALPNNIKEGEKL